MMIYKYRWLYAILLSSITLLIGYFYDLKEKWIHLAELKKNEKSFLERSIHTVSLTAQNNKSGPTLFLPKQSELMLIANMVKLARMTGLSILSIQSGNQRAAHFFTLQMVTEGQFVQASAFIEELEKLKGMKIFRFSCQLSSQLLVRMELEIGLPFSSLQSSLAQMSSHTISLKRNPFCIHSTINEPQFYYSDSKLLSFPVAGLKMVGYLQQGKHVQALLLLPNNDLAAVEQGVVVGKELASVTAIQPDRIQVTWQTKHHFIFLQSQGLVTIP